MVILVGLGETDLNQTVLFGITLCPTSLESGSPKGMSLDLTWEDILSLSWKLDKVEDFN